MTPQVALPTLGGGGLHNKLNGCAILTNEVITYSICNNETYNIKLYNIIKFGQRPIYKKRHKMFDPFGSERVMIIMMAMIAYLLQATKKNNRTNHTQNKQHKTTKKTINNTTQYKSDSPLKPMNTSAL